MCVYIYTYIHIYIKSSWENERRERPGCAAPPGSCAAWQPAPQLGTARTHHNLAATDHISAREIGDLLPNNQRQRRTCYALCHILYPVSAAHTSIFRMDSNSISYVPGWNNVFLRLEEKYASLLFRLLCYSRYRSWKALEPRAEWYKKSGCIRWFYRKRDSI